MDYSLQVFAPECNLPQDGKVRERIESKLGLKKAPETQNIPILLQILMIAQQHGLSMPPKEQSNVPADALIRNDQNPSANSVTNPAFAAAKYGGFMADDNLT